MKVLRKILKQRGQTAIEYIMMLAVVGGLGMTFMKKMDEYLLQNPNSYINNYLNSYKAVLKADPKYQRFQLIR